MRLNAYLARAGVASRRGADELIKAGRVPVNGAPGELNTFVEAANVVEVDGRAVAQAGTRARAAATSRAGRHDRARPAGAADGGRPRRRRTRGRAGRTARRRHHRRARADERRPARAPAGPSAVRRREGLRRGRRGRAGRRGADAGSPTASSSRTGRPRRPASAVSGRRGSSSSCTKAETARCSGCSRPSGIRSSSLRRSRYAGLGPGRPAPGRLAPADAGRGARSASPRRTLTIRNQTSVASTT